MSAPFVSGLLALCLQANPNLTYSQAIRLLRNSAITDSYTGEISSTGSNFWGWGKVNVTGMVDSVCIVTPPYTEDFEGNTCCWMREGNDGANQWVIGTTVNHTEGGDHALYISRDGGTTDGYTLSSASSVYAYRLLSLEAGNYTVSFDWKANGERNYDYLRAALVPAYMDLSSVEFWNYSLLSEGYIPIDGGGQLVESLVWTTQTSIVNIPTSGDYNLVFYWRNNSRQGNNPAAAIDNIHIEAVPPPDPLTVTVCDSYTWHENTYTESGDYTYTYTDDNNNPQIEVLHLTVNHPAHVATTVTASNSYSWHGLDYYYSGDYLYNLIDANHCTQVDTLHLTITNPLNNVVEYWFDQNHDTRMTIVVNSTDWQGQIDVSSLDFGLHTLYMHLRDNEGRCSPPRSALFYKGFDGNMSYTCWFDQNFASQQTIPFADNSMQVDVNWLNDGLHTLNMQIGNGVSAELHSYIFFKMPFEGCSDLVYTCWFDRDYNLRVSGQLSTGTLLLNTDGLTDGLHILNMITGSGATAELRSYVFYKIPSNASLADASTLLYHYSIDGVQQPTLQVSPQNRMIHLNLDVDNTGEGLHSLTGCLMTSNGSSMALHSSWFYTVPAGGEGISRYEYWLNDDFENRTVVDVTPFVDTLQVITLLQLDTMPINSNDFEFDPNGGNPVIRSRNNITFRFWNSALRMTSTTRQYVDQQMVETILTDTLERDTTKFFATPGTGQIHWFKLESGVGDSMSFHTNSRCTMQLYTPSGEMVIQASGDSVLTWKGCRVWENGVCYLAIHDAEGSGDMSVSYDFYENQHCHSTINVTACDSYNWNGETYTSSGTHVYSTIGHGGCDSVATLHLTIYTSNSAAETVTACNSYTWHGSTYTASTTTPTYTTTNAVGCDSVTTLHLTVNYSTSSTETVTACDSYTWHGSTYTASTTTPTYTTTNVVGCDSVTTLHLTVNYSSSNTETVTACDSYTWHGTIYNTSTTTPTYTTTNAVGCDSVTTLHLTISYSDTTTETVTACDSLIWHNSTYTASTATPTYTTTNAFGCDSVTTLHLTINYSDTTTETVTACDSIIWHDSIYTASTLSPQFITLNAAGCDSTVTLHLTINYSSYNTIVDTGVNHYEWQGNTYTESGEYVYEGLTEVGCDSIIVLQLIITEVGIGTNDSLSGIILCPNPTTGKLTIAADGISLVEVFDPNGRNVATFHDTNVIDISHLPTGAYSLRITLRNGTSVKRVIKH